MPVHDDLGTRMKEYYESVPKIKLVRRMPVVIRVDGRAFHTFTRGFKKPFDDVLIASMQDTMKYLCENIQGCILGYTQSDEITLILIDYQNLNTSAWFDYEVQKVCSISASMTTLAFNKAFEKTIKEQADHELFNLYCRAMNQGAMFDARCFNIPKEEVTNLILWRIFDCERNSIQMCGQSFFSQKQLQYKSCKDIKEMLNNEQNFNWDRLENYLKYGTLYIKNKGIINIENKTYSFLSNKIKSCIFIGEGD